VASSKDHARLSAQLESNFSALPQWALVQRNHKRGLWFFPVDNTKGSGDQGISELRQGLYRVIEEQTWVKEKHPIGWIKTLDA
jgi:hypothetical protein